MSQSSCIGSRASPLHVGAGVLNLPVANGRDVIAGPAFGFVARKQLANASLKRDKEYHGTYHQDDEECGHWVQRLV